MGVKLLIYVKVCHDVPLVDLVNFIKTFELIKKQIKDIKKMN